MSEKNASYCLRNLKTSCQLWVFLRASHLYPCQAAAQTSTNPQIAPTSGRVSKVSVITEAAATPTITTHLNTASSVRFIIRKFVP